MVLPGKGLSWKEFGHTLYREFNRDNVMDVAGSVTYFAVLAVFPFLLFLVSLASVIISPTSAEELVRQLGGVAPAAVTDILGSRIRELGRANNVGLLTFGALGAIWAASGGVMALMRALNAMYDVQESRGVIKQRLVAIGMTLAIAVFALTAAFIAVAVPPIADRIGGPVSTLVTWLRIPVAALLMMFLWAVLYYVLPDVEQKFRFITPGSVFGVMVWALASWGFSVYVANFGNYDATYGALGGVIVLLLWMWISSMVVLLGAEINAVLEHKSPEGKRAGAKSMKDTGASQTKDEREEQKHRELAMWARHGKRAFHRQKAEEANTLGARAKATATNVGLAVLLGRLFGRREA